MGESSVRIETRRKEDSFQVSLLSEQGEIQNIKLTGQLSGEFRFKNAESNSLCYFKVINSKWHVILENSLYCEMMGRRIQSAELEDEMLLFIHGLPMPCSLYVQRIKAGQNVFRNYFVRFRESITIGRGEQCDIFYPNRYVSKLHAIMQRQENGLWRIEDVSSGGGVYINGTYRKAAQLKLGDVVFVVGLEIIVGQGYLSVNKNVKVNPRKLKTREKSDHFVSPLEGDKKEDVFNREPVERKGVEKSRIILEAPPMAISGNKIPMLLRMGGSLAMGGGALLSGNVLMAMTSMFFPLLTQGFTEKDRKEYEELRHKSYHAYLEQKEEEIRLEIEKENRILNRNYPEISEILKYPYQKKGLWSRRTVDRDFLTIRLGHGKRKMAAELEYPRRGFTVEEDHLLNDMYELAERDHCLEHAPILLELKKDNVCGLVGDREKVIALIRAVIHQIVLLHSYEEVKLVLLVSGTEIGEFEFVRGLPHVWDDEKEIRFLVTNSMDSFPVSEYLQNEFSNRMEDDLDKTLKGHPYYVCIAMDRKIYDSMEVIKSLIKDGKNKGFSVITAFDDLLIESNCYIQMAGQRASLLYLDEGEKDSGEFTLDEYDLAAARQSMSQLSNIILNSRSASKELPKMISFMEMLSAGKVQDLNVLKRWKENNPVKSLSAPVGVMSDGSLFELNLHEKAQGPHGLVAGMTGSGKSEFIITYILSMAVNYHPDEVAFILIDYKGGGLAGAFEDPARGIHLPHLVGTITNLDGASIQRSLMSIQSELLRRQTLFNKAKSMTGEGTMDIYAYQKLFRERKVKEALPHLFIISDEFAELKQQQPDFMDQLISAARIGRSLGVHLILATQKPSGVVNEQIRSNTKFRICLRVQDKSDSMDMIKRPDAAELKDTGRFYLQVGYDEYFAMGQSAWCGAEYEEQDSIVRKQDNSIRFVNDIGMTIHQESPQVISTGTGTQQLVAVVKYLSKLAEQENMKPKKLWMDELPRRLSMDSIPDCGEPERDHFEIPVGLIDDPIHQRQYAYKLGLQNSKNIMIIGESGSGKSTFLQTLLLSVTKTYAPSEIGFYILDFSSHLLRVFEHAPHCGGYLDENDEDGVRRFFEMLREIIDERKKIFAEHEAGSFISLRQSVEMPLLLVVIDNINILMSLQRGNVYYNTLNEYARDGVSYGIVMIITAGHLNEINGRTKQEFGTRIAFRAKDRFVYSEILQCKCTYTPPEVVGRGMCVGDSEPREFHTAIYFSESGESERMGKIREAVKSLSNKDNNSLIKKIPVRREDERVEDFCVGMEPERMPLGYSEKDMKKVYYPFQQLFKMAYYFGNPYGEQPIVHNLFYAAELNKMEIIFVKKSHNSIMEDNSNIEVLSCTDSDYEALWKRLVDEITERKQFRNEYCEARNLPIDNSEETMRGAAHLIRKNSTPLLVYIESLYEFCKNITEDARIILEKIFQEGKGYHIYFFGGLYPDDATKLSGDILFNSLKKDMDVLAYGGQFDRIGLTALPAEYRGIQKIVEDYQKGLLFYRQRWNVIYTPCGGFSNGKAEKDEGDII